LLAFRLLKSANLSPADEKLAKGTAKLEFDAMKDQLKKLFSENTSFQTSNSERVEDIQFSDNAQENENYTYYTKNRPYCCRGRYTPSSRGAWAPINKIGANLATSHNSMRVLLPDQIKKKIPKMTKGL